MQITQGSYAVFRYVLFTGLHCKKHSGSCTAPNFYSYFFISFYTHIYYHHHLTNFNNFIFF